MVTETRTRAIRSDGLPEGTEYRDEGCEYAPSCLSCPFVQCRFDIPGGIRGLRKRQRDHELRLARCEDEATAIELAARFGVSRRTVFRATQALMRDRGDE